MQLLQVLKKKMKNNMFSKLRMAFKGGLVGCATFLLLGCISKAPQTVFYSLSPLEISGNSSQRVDGVLILEGSLGVGPIVLPEYMRSSQIVSFTEQTRIRVAANAAWAGDVNANVTRVLTSYLSTQNHVVQSFPWDSRARPDWQLLMRFESFGGTKGQSISLSAHWQLINTRQKQVVDQGKVTVSEQLTSTSTQAYIEGINKGLRSFSSKLALVLGKNMNRPG